MTPAAPTPRPDATAPLGVRVAPPAPGVLAPGTRLDRFEVHGVLGQGATGVVYEVRHVQLGTRHALKVLTWAHPQLQVRLLAEGRAQASLRHPNIVRVLDLIQVGEAPALLMELVSGPSLEQRIHAGRVPTDEALRWFHQILAGVGAAHARGFVHRDLKPANILLAEEGGRTIPKITDFGLAKALDSDIGLTDTGMTMGTPAYMAPEQIRRARGVDQRADIFSLGCILYELLAGRPPHGGTDPLAVLNAVAEGRVRPLRQDRPDLPAHVLRAVKEAMEVDPARRLPSCEAFEAALDDEPASLAPTSAWHIAEPPEDEPAPPGAAEIGARPWFVALAAAVGLALLPVGGALGWALSAEPAPPSQVAVHDPSPSAPLTVAPDRRTPARVAPPPALQGPPPRVESTSRPQPATAQVRAEPPACRSGWVRLPPRVRPPRPGPWHPKRSLEAHHGTPDDPGPAACSFGPDVTLEVAGEPVKTAEGRWIWVWMR